MANDTLKVGGWSNLWNKWTGRAMTNAQQEVNAFNANEAQKARDFEEQMSNTAYQRQVADMEAAGVNPALAMQGAANGASTPNGEAAQAGADPTGGLSMSDLMGALMSPLTIVQGIQDIRDTKAAIRVKEEEARNIAQRTETERFNTEIAHLNSIFQGLFNDADLRNKLAQYHNITADTDYKVANTNYVNDQDAAQKILNIYLPLKSQAELDEIRARRDKEVAEKDKIVSERIYQQWYNNFVRANGFLPSSNDALQIATYIGEVIGLSKEELSKFVDRLLDGLKGWNPGKGLNRDRGKGGETSPEGGEGAAGSGSRE